MFSIAAAAMIEAFEWPPRKFAGAAFCRESSFANNHSLRAKLVQQVPQAQRWILRIWVLFTKTRFKDGQRPAHDRLRVGQPIRVLQQLREVVECGCHIRVVIPEAGLITWLKTIHELSCVGNGVFE